jgi:hypothetical protein
MDKMTQQIISKNDVEENLLGDLIDENLPERWKVVSIGKINKATSVTINPLLFPEEVFEYYSIPAFQENG